jgi:hypothetical protein
MCWVIYKIAAPVNRKDKGNLQLILITGIHWLPLASFFLEHELIEQWSYETTKHHIKFTQKNSKTMKQCNMISIDLLYSMVFLFLNRYYPEKVKGKK